MLRLLIFLLWVVFAAFVITLALSLGASINIDAFGWRLDVPAGVAGFALVLLAGLTALIVSLWKDWTGMRRRSLLRAVLKRREKGVGLLVSAAGAYQAADYRKAEKLSAKAAKLLDRDAVAELFKAPPEPGPQPMPEVEPEAEPAAEPDAAPSAGEDPESREIAVAPAPARLPPPTEQHSAAPPPDAAAPPPPDAFALRPEEADAEAAADRDVAAARQVS